MPKITPITEPMSTTFQCARHVAHAVHPAGELEALLGDGAALAEHDDHLGDAEQAERQDGECRAVEQIGDAEGVAQLRRRWRNADGAE